MLSEDWLVLPSVGVRGNKPVSFTDLWGRISLRLSCRRVKIRFLAWFLPCPFTLFYFCFTLLCFCFLYMCTFLHPFPHSVTFLYCILRVCILRGPIFAFCFISATYSVAYPVFFFAQFLHFIPFLQHCSTCSVFGRSIFRSPTILATCCIFCILLRQIFALCLILLTYSRPSCFPSPNFRICPILVTFSLYLRSSVPNFRILSHSFNVFIL